MNGKVNKRIINFLIKIILSEGIPLISKERDNDTNRIKRDNNDNIDDFIMCQLSI